MPIGSLFRPGGGLRRAILDCAGRAGAATALSGGWEAERRRKIGARAKAVSRPPRGIIGHFSPVQCTPRIPRGKLCHRSPGPGGRSRVSAARRKPCRNSDGGLLPKAATQKWTGRGAHARCRAMTETRCRCGFGARFAPANGHANGPGCGLSLD